MGEKKDATHSVFKDFTTTVSIIGKTAKQKISMVQEDSKSTVDLLG